MENTNEMKIIFDSRPENEGLARVAAAAFCTQLILLWRKWQI